MLGRFLTIAFHVVRFARQFTTIKGRLNRAGGKFMLRMSSCRLMLILQFLIIRLILTMGCRSLMSLVSWHRVRVLDHVKTLVLILRPVNNINIMMACWMVRSLIVALDLSIRKMISCLMGVRIPAIRLFLRLANNGVIFIGHRRTLMRHCLDGLVNRLIVLRVLPSFIFVRSRIRTMIELAIIPFVKAKIMFARQKTLLKRTLTARV